MFFRLRVRDTRKDLAIERLLALVRRRSAEDIEALVDVSARILARWL